MMFGVVLIVGLALAGFAVYMVQGYFAQQQTALAQEQELRMKTGPLVEVYVLNKPLNYGDPITPEDVQVIYWQENALPEGIFRDTAALFPAAAKGPRYMMRGTGAFEPLLASRVTEPGEAAGLTGKLGPGLGAFTIRVDASSGLAGLQPEDRVDVYWTGVAPGGNEEVTRLIEAAVQIIAVDQEPKVAGDDALQMARTVTVSGTRDKIARLAQAQATGRLALSVVGHGAVAENGKVEVTGSSLLGITAEDVVQVEAARVCTTRVRKGGASVDEQIPCSN
jgi:pilus assembly protein CpaB